MAEVEDKIKEALRELERWKNRRGKVKTRLENDDADESDPGTQEVQPDFELNAFDFVSNPSTQGAFMYPMNESVDSQNPVGRTCGDYCKAEDIINKIIRGE